MSRALLLLSAAVAPLLLLLLLPLAQPAQSMAVSQLCLTLDAAVQAVDAKALFCGFPLPGSGAVDVPIACHRQPANIRGLLTKEPGLSALAANQICYLKYTENTEPTGFINLSLDIVQNRYETAREDARVRFLPSVSELVGASSILVLSGPILRHINPEIFADIGQAQRDTLKVLVLSNTGVEEIDLSMFEPLRISGLILISNQRLRRITNVKRVKLLTLTELIFWNNNASLVDCRNFLALPDNLTTIGLLQGKLDGNCSLCYLPKGVKTVLSKQDVAKLPFHGSVTPGDSMIPFPLGKPYASIDGIPGLEPFNEFSASQATASGCQQACNCQPWPLPESSVPKTSTSTTSAPKASVVGAEVGKERSSTDTGTSGGGNSAVSQFKPSSMVAILLATAAAAMQQFSFLH